MTAFEIVSPSILISMDTKSSSVIEALAFELLPEILITLFSGKCRSAKYSLKFSNSISERGLEVVVVLAVPLCAPLGIFSESMVN